ncbi:MAG: SIMPL domain-containing protein [Candidatus Sphingomonas colombiensis]|nr:SIMPL domain-containing protein [Sphingomonas sp.]WEK44086.1 MAG: SIMPL domain-containing protein [Sphingomonas sp.]
MSVDKPEAALDEARGDAVTHRAGTRAELYARAAGLRVVRILSINENGENGGGIAAPAGRVCARRESGYGRNPDRRRRDRIVGDAGGAVSAAIRRSPPARDPRQSQRKLGSQAVRR